MAYTSDEECEARDPDVGICLDGACVQCADYEDCDDRSANPECGDDGFCAPCTSTGTIDYCRSAFSDEGAPAPGCDTATGYCAWCLAGLDCIDGYTTPTGGTLQTQGFCATDNVTCDFYACTDDAECRSGFECHATYGLCTEQS